MTPDELKQALTAAGWRISPNSIRRDDVQWYAWLPSTNTGRIGNHGPAAAVAALRVALAAPAQPAQPSGKFKVGDRVRKTKGSQWHGRIVGWYSTELTPVGWAIESDTERGSVQIYPEAALERVPEDSS